MTSHARRAALGFAALILIAFAAGVAPHIARGAVEPDSDGWSVLFRSDNPLDWNYDRGKPAAKNGFAVKLEGNAPDDMRFLRLKRMDTGDAVIVGLPRELLYKSQPIEGNLWWSGAIVPRGSREKPNRLLGIARLDWAASKAGDHLVRRVPGKMNIGYRGWGFSKEATTEPDQTWCWAGEPIKKTVFEIAVKGGELTDMEKAQQLTSDAKPPADTMEPVAGGEGGEDDGAAPPATRMARRQTSIKALYIADTPTGQLGLASDLILTATPGNPPKRDKDRIAPVSFATKAGNEMHIVLDDVLRAIKVKYPSVTGVSKIELSFEDKYTPKDGGSIGAAIGTLMLSMIEGFEIDDKLAITGDVTADSKVRRIGGVAAKMRGATAAGCRIVALPADNYEQVADALVYDGAAVITNIQVVGVANLSEATALARTSRDGKLLEALSIFDDVQQTLKKPGASLRTKAVQDKLAKIPELAPNHFSAKLLLLAAQDKQPKRLSSGASLYYTVTAINSLTPALSDRTASFNKGQVAQITSTAIQDGLKNLDKVRRLGHPDVIPLVDSFSQFVRELRDVQAGTGSFERLETRRQKLIDTLAKMQSDRAMVERILREGV